jgi:acyl-coenzyme A thioesterase PaaI-like protein
VRTAASIQESLFPQLRCYGCGPASLDGLKLRSYRDGPNTVADFEPRAEHENGFGFLNGGIIATILDCHGAAAVMSEVARQGWRDPHGALTPFVTASFDLRFHRPTPIGRVVRLEAWLEAVSPAELVVRSDLAVDDKVTATMTATWARLRRADRVDGPEQSAP